MKAYRYRSAVTGEYVTEAEAKADPERTVGETDNELLEGIAREYSEAQQILREVGMHWTGRPLVESVREAVDEILRERCNRGM